jgi:7-cyano-7-deazaguanine reductase
VSGEPFVHARAAAEPLLQLRQRMQSRLQGSQALRAGRYRRIVLAQGLLGLRQFAFLRLELSPQDLQGAIERSELFAQVCEAREIRGLQRGALLAQPVAALGEPREGFASVHLARVFDLEILLGERQGALQLLVTIARGAECFLRYGQPLAFRLHRRLACGCEPRRAVALGGPFRQAGPGSGEIDVGTRELGAVLGKLALDALAAVTEVRQLLLEAGGVGIGLVERALGRMHLVARAEVLCTNLLQLALRPPQTRGLRLEFQAEALDLAAMTRPARRCLLPAQQPQQVLRGRQASLQLVIAGGDLGLRREVLELLVELLPDVVHPQQILARVGKAQLRLAPALAVLRYARRLLQKDAQLLGLRLDHPGDHALLHDGIGARAKPGSQKDVRDVPPPHVDIVDVVGGRLPVALEHPPDGDLRVARPLPAGAAEAVVEYELDAGTVDGLSLAGAVEQHVLHGLAAQVTRGRFAQHPAHGVDHVRLAAAVGADDTYQLSGDGDVGGFYERLEASEIDLLESQVGVLMGGSSEGEIGRYNPSAIWERYSSRERARMPAKPSRQLATFLNPERRRDYRIHMEIPEFTCICPRTGQPDFAHLTLDYVPDRLCVELKSLKLYVWSFRDEGAFHEAVVNRMLDDLVRATRPRYLRLAARFYVRGGISTTVVAAHRRRGWRPQRPVDLGAIPEAPAVRA